MTAPDAPDAPDALDAFDAELDGDAALDTRATADADDRLTLDQALAELDRATAAVLEVEHRHGFTFGPTGEVGPGVPSAAVVCTSAGCPRQGKHVQLHDDTVQPVHCGGCGAVLLCDHDNEIRRYRDGTLAAPVEHTVTACRVCGFESGRVSRDLDPAEVLRSIPLATLDQLLGG